MENINAQTVLTLCYLLDVQMFYAHLLRLQVERDRALLLYLVNTYPAALTDTDCESIGDALTAIRDVIGVAA